MTRHCPMGGRECDAECSRVPAFKDLVSCQGGHAREQFILTKLMGPDRIINSLLGSEREGWTQVEVLGDK